MRKKNKKRVLFITGTRADYGKIKALMKTMEQSDSYEVFIYVSGMHLLAKYGSTYREVLKDGYQNVYVAFGQPHTENMSYNLGGILTSLSSYVVEIDPDMIIVHGDRIDALAGAITGALNNILVAHIEGGELSGTIDDSIRHAISKFAHLHFVCNKEAQHRIMQLGECEENIFIIGSPDIDIMISENLPGLAEAKAYYEIPFEEYGIFMYHPVTTELGLLKEHITATVNALIQSGKQYIVVYPNNDSGTEIIVEKVEELAELPDFRVFPSIRFEFFLTLLKHATMIIGNSSSGIRESGVYGVPDIDIGSRQNGRYDINTLRNIQHVEEDVQQILQAIKKAPEYAVQCQNFGRGNSADKFLAVLESPDIWERGIQKRFVDLID